MNLKEFQGSLEATVPPEGIAEPLQALWREAKGDWDGAHAIVRSNKSKASSRVHAYLHRKEGDIANSKFWHERAGSMLPDVPVEKEWEMLVVSLLK
jgi:hypothetical protein